MLTKEEKIEIIKCLKEELIKPKKVYVEICRENIELPKYRNEGDAGMDVCSAININIKPNETIVIPTGLKMAIPDNYEIQVRPRSGISLKTPLRIANTPGTIDSGYKDEIGIILTNTSTKNTGTYLINETENKQGTYEIKKGDRIAQIVLCKYEKIEFLKVEEEKIKILGTNRGGGFGHTGTN